LPQPVDTSLSAPAVSSHIAAGPIRSASITPNAAGVQPAISAPAQTASLAHKALPQGNSLPVAKHIAVAHPPKPAALPAQSGPMAEPTAIPASSGPAQPAANPSTANLPAADALNLPVGTIIVSPGVLARVNRHNRYGQGHDWPISITIISPPAHGTVTTQDGTAPVTYSNGVTRISVVTQVFYQSAPGYVGMDTFTYKRTSGDPADPLNANTYTMSIDVKP
jgi:hypothetical protein